jgi:isopenicillin-N epimerase
VIAQNVPLPVTDLAQVVETIWAGVTPRTRVLYLSHITSPTAITFPIEALIERARGAGIWTVVDGAHAVGQVPIDLHRLGVDFYGGNCHKWLSAPKGAGFLYVRRELQHLIEPPIVSWGWRPNDPGPSAFVDQLERQGTRDPAAYLCVPAAIEYQAARDWPRVRGECHALARLARQSLSEITGLPELVPDDPRWFTQMAILPLPPCDHELLKRRLYDEYRIEIPVLRPPGYNPWLRISVQGYTTRTDIQHLAHAVRALLPELRT